jgi:hypothetical protein
MLTKTPNLGQVFKSYLDEFKQRFAGVSPYSFDQTLDRIACDPRATDVWGLIASQPEHAHKFFYQIVIVFWLSQLSVHDREGQYYDSHKHRSDIEDAIEACNFLGKFCVSSSVLKCPLHADLEKLHNEQALSFEPGSSR